MKSHLLSLSSLALIMIRSCFFILSIQNLASGAKLPPFAPGGAPIFQDECKEPGLNDCPSTSICVDRFYGYHCQCISGFIDKSPDIEEDPGRVCVQETAASSNTTQETRTVNKERERTTTQETEKTTTVNIERSLAQKTRLKTTATQQTETLGQTTETTTQRQNGSETTTQKTEITSEVTPSQEIELRDQDSPKKSSSQKRGRGKKEEAGRAALNDTFNIFDFDKNGQINVTELRAATRNNDLVLSDADIKLMLQTADADGDEEVSFDEFKTLMKTRRQSST